MKILRAGQGQSTILEEGLLVSCLFLSTQALVCLLRAV